MLQWTVALIPLQEELFRYLVFTPAQLPGDSRNRLLPSWRNFVLCPMMRVAAYLLMPSFSLVLSTAKVKCSLCLEEIFDRIYPVNHEERVITTHSVWVLMEISVCLRFCDFRRKFVPPCQGLLSSNPCFPNFEYTSPGKNAASLRKC